MFKKTSASSPSLNKTESIMLRPFRAIRKFFRGSKKSSKVFSMSTGSVFTTAYEEEIEKEQERYRRQRENDHTSSNYRRVISLSHDSVFMMNNQVTSSRENQGYRSAVSQEFLNYITVPGTLDRTPPQSDDEDYQFDSSIETLPPATPLFTSMKLNKKSASLDSFLSFDMDGLPPAVPLENKAARDRIAVRPNRRPPTRNVKNTQASNKPLKISQKSSTKPVSLTGNTSTRLPSEEKKSDIKKKYSFNRGALSPTSLNLEDIQKIELRKTPSKQANNSDVSTVKPITQNTTAFPQFKSNNTTKYDVNESQKSPKADSSIVTSFSKLKQSPVSNKNEKTNNIPASIIKQRATSLKRVEVSVEKKGTSDAKTIPKLKKVEQTSKSFNEIDMKDGKIAWNKSMLKPVKVEEGVIKVEKQPIPNSPNKINQKSSPLNPFKMRDSENNKVNATIPVGKYRSLSDSKENNEIEKFNAKIKSKYSFDDKCDEAPSWVKRHQKSETQETKPEVKSDDTLSNFVSAKSKFLNSNNNNNNGNPITINETSRDMFVIKEGVPPRPSENSKIERSISVKIPRNPEWGISVANARKASSSAIDENAFPTSLKSTGKLDTLLNKENRSNNVVLGDSGTSDIYSRVTNSVFITPNKSTSAAEKSTNAKKVLNKTTDNKNKSSQVNKAMSFHHRNAPDKVIIKPLNDDKSSAKETGGQPTWVALARSRSTKWDTNQKMNLQTKFQSDDDANNNNIESSKYTPTDSGHTQSIAPWHNLAMQKRKSWIQEAQ